MYKVLYYDDVHQVTLIARGAHLEAMKKNGLKLVMSDGEVLVADKCIYTSNMKEVRERY